MIVPFVSTLATLTLLFNVNPAAGLNISDIGNIVDKVNNKYNTFSLVEYLMDDLEDYMQAAYAELKNILTKKINQTRKLLGQSTKLSGLGTVLDSGEWKRIRRTVFCQVSMPETVFRDVYLKLVVHTQCEVYARCYV